MLNEHIKGINLQNPNTQLFDKQTMDIIIGDIVEIFVNIEGVELVRLSGLLKRLRAITGANELSVDTIHSIIRALQKRGIIKYNYITVCPYCEEVSYYIVELDTTKPKICDTCSSNYGLINGATLIREQV